LTNPNIFFYFVDVQQKTKVVQACIKLPKNSTVKPELTATSEQRPPANNGQPKPSQIKFNSNFD
jgi:hypothetical protein